MSSLLLDPPAKNEWTPARADRKLLTAREAAAILQVSERSLYNYSRRGELPAVRMGRSVRYDPIDLWRFVESSKVAGQQFIEGSNDGNDWK